MATSLALTGVLLCVLAYLVLRSTPLTALGLSIVIIGAVSFAISRSQPRIPAEASAILLQSGVENISAVVEELGIKSKAIYLPSSMTGDKPKALIPLNSSVEFGVKSLPKRFIVKYGPKPQDVGLLVITPGSAVGGMVTTKPNCSAQDLESAVSQVVSGMINLVDGVRATINAEKILVELINPRLEADKMWIYESMGTPIASLTASIVAQVLDKPVFINSESTSKGKSLIELKLVGRSP
jgi:hypothetical protein